MVSTIRLSLSTPKSYFCPIFKNYDSLIIFLVHAHGRKKSGVWKFKKYLKNVQRARKRRREEGQEAISFPVKQPISTEKIKTSDKKQEEKSDESVPQVMRGYPKIGLRPCPGVDVLMCASRNTRRYYLLCTEHPGTELDTASYFRAYSSKSTT
jgi:hypothetical protein